MYNGCYPENNIVDLLGKSIFQFDGNITTTVNEHCMRKRGEWMSRVDDRILEAIRQDGNLTPLAVSREGLVPRVDIGRKYAGVRCRKLTEYGLLNRVDKGLYGITELGEQFLDEELDTETLEKSEIDFSD
ncbi:PhiH1 repressor [Haloferax sp. Atlit-6N]|uniref:PhiH1 repressor n=1 Tax=Haloferax sp. Atlit-6N TaxID=2077205 RepID=UPI001F47903D|nr:PhiH1 repressor [Haloferax sp. Atlit-6N]